MSPRPPGTSTPLSEGGTGSDFFLFRPLPAVFRFSISRTSLRTNIIVFKTKKLHSLGLSKLFSLRRKEEVGHEGNQGTGEGERGLLQTSPAGQRGFTCPWARCSVTCHSGSALQPWPSALLPDPLVRTRSWFPPAASARLRSSQGPPKQGSRIGKGQREETPWGSKGAAPSCPSHSSPHPHGPHSHPGRWGQQGAADPARSTTEQSTKSGTCPSGTAPRSGGQR